MAEPGAERDWQATRRVRSTPCVRARMSFTRACSSTTTWHGISDFLVRVNEPSDLGSWSYEAWDTKLARHEPKPYFVLQLCFYTERLATIQGREPEWMTSSSAPARKIASGIGTSRRITVPCAAASWRRRRRRADTYPYPVSHCALCEHDSGCRARREADDHLSLVAGIRRTQVERLEDAGIRTVAALAVGPAVAPDRHRHARARPASPSGSAADALPPAAATHSLRAAAG